MENRIGGDDKALLHSTIKGSVSVDTARKDCGHHIKSHGRIDEGHVDRPILLQQLPGGK